MSVRARERYAIFLVKLRWGGEGERDRQRPEKLVPLYKTSLYIIFKPGPSHQN